MEFLNYNKNIKAVICRNIKKYRKEADMSVYELSEKVDVTPEHLKRIESENDRNNISLITLYKISIALRTRIDKFFED